MLREFISELLSLDGQLPQTLAALVRPGRLTRLYLDGKRAPYLRAPRLYAVASLVLFASVLGFQVPDADQVDVAVGNEVINPHPEGPRNARVQVYDPDSWIMHWLAARHGDRLERLKSLPPQELLNMLFAGLRRALPLVLILFLPVLALALKLLYLRTGILYVDHLIFAIHFQCALFLALSAIWLMAWVLGIGVGISLMAYIFGGFLMLAIYLPMALRRVYRQSRWFTAVKTILVLFAYFRLFGLIMTAAMAYLILRI